MLHDDCLTHGDPNEVAAFLGVSLRTLRRYQKDPDTIPEPLKKMLRLRLEGDLRAMGGDAWEGFYLQRGKLFMPMWERAIAPDALKAMFFQVQEVAALRSEVKKLRGELWAARKVQALSAPDVLPVKFDRRRA